MEWKIGEIKQVNGEWYQCIARSGCQECDLKTNCKSTVICIANGIQDRVEVIFKKLEKVGETFTIEGILYQHYKVFDIDNVCGGDVFWCVHNYKAKTLTIEIKQNKEDMGDLDKIKVRDYTKVEELNVMEEKKQQADKLVTDYTANKITYKEFEKSIIELYADKHTEEKKLNLKPFDIQKAREGKPVCTRDGRKARIICFDRKFYYNECNYTIVAMVNEYDDNDNEFIHGYTQNGLLVENAANELDLMMLPEKKEGWVNVYRDCDGANITKDDNIYSSKDAAIASAQIIDGDNYIATTIIKWEE